MFRLLEGVDSTGILTPAFGYEGYGYEERNEA